MPVLAPTVAQLIQIVMGVKGDRYVLGAEARFSDPHPLELDCSELFEWAIAGRLGLPFPDGAANQLEFCRRHGTLITIEAAIALPGTLLFRVHPGGGGGRGNHVAGSIGGGMTFEARGRAYGVNTFSARGRSWTHAAKVPGLDYSQANRPFVVIPGGRTVTPQDVLTHDALGRAETLAGRIARHFHIDPATVVPKLPPANDGLTQSQYAAQRVESIEAAVAQQIGA
jgi:hypothetical protein